MQQHELGRTPSSCVPGMIAVAALLLASFADFVFGQYTGEAAIISEGRKHPGDGDGDGDSADAGGTALMARILV